MTYQGFTTYAPREKITRVVRGKKQNTSRWLFPRYIFVWIADHWHALFNTIGVSKVLMTGDHPARLPDKWVEAMRAREHHGLITLPKHRFRIGQRVVVASGLLLGAHGIYQGMGNQQREIVLLESLGHVELASGLLR